MQAAAGLGRAEGRSWRAPGVGGGRLGHRDIASAKASTHFMPGKTEDQLGLEPLAEAPGVEGHLPCMWLWRQETGPGPATVTTAHPAPLPLFGPSDYFF